MSKGGKKSNKQKKNKAAVMKFEKASKPAATEGAGGAEANDKDRPKHGHVVGAVTGDKTKHDPEHGKKDKKKTKAPATVDEAMAMDPSDVPLLPLEEEPVPAA